MSNPETAVRDAAQALHLAITDAREAGLYVAWPSSPEGLPGIAVSETKRVADRDPAAAPPVRRKSMRLAPDIKEISE